VFDCEAVIAGGMGSGDYMPIEEADVKPFLTDKMYVDVTVPAYINGTLDNQVERLH
jgi:hypothetical protein